MPPAKSLRRTSPLSDSHSASAANPTSRSDASTNDSSDDEKSIPKLSAAAEELLGVRTGERPVGRGALINDSHWLQHGEGSPIGREDYKAKSVLGREHTISPAAYRSGSPRVVKLSGGYSGSARLRRALSVANVYDGSPLSSRGAYDMKTPVPRPKSILGGPSSAENGGNYSGKPSSGESVPVGASTAHRTRSDDAAMHNSLRVKRISKVTGSFLSGPARRGMIRRQSEEDQVPYAAEEHQPIAESKDEWAQNRNKEPGQYPPSLPFREQLKASQRVRSASRSTSPAQVGVPVTQRAPNNQAQAREPMNTRSPANTNASKSALNNGATTKQPRAVFKVADLPPLPSINDQENVPPPTFKRDKPGVDVLAKVEKPKPENNVGKVQLQSSPSRKALAPRSHNTPLRPAPPPPKMSVLETATATAGAASVAHGKKKTRNLITVNGKQFTRMECVGRGGSGRVYRVMAENFKLFAVKCVSLEDLDELTIRGFKGEIELLRRLENVDRVVRLYDYEINEEKKSLRVLMDIGELDLKKVLEPRLDEESGKFDATFTRYIWKEMLECVSAVHAHDIVHSDLKPPNFVMIQGRLKIIDFGIANAIQDDTVNVHREQQVGTPNYMSPETLVDTNAGRHASNLQAAAAQHQQAHHHSKLMKVGKASDVWSLGCILYQIVYGKPPFGHITNNVRKVMAITDPNHSISFPSYGLGKVPVPTGLIRTLRKCLDRDASRRPTVEQLLGGGDLFLHPDAPGTVPVSQELIGRLQHNIIHHIQSHGVPSEEELKAWPAKFFASIRAAVEEGRA